MQSNPVDTCTCSPMVKKTAVRSPKDDSGDNEMKVVSSPREVVKAAPTEEAEDFFSPFLPSEAKRGVDNQNHPSSKALTATDFGAHPVVEQNNSTVNDLACYNHLDDVDSLNSVGGLGLTSAVPSHKGDPKEKKGISRIVFLGDSNAGKSSCCERVIGNPILPRKNGTCTRSPVIVRTHRDEDARIFGKIRIELTLPRVGSKDEVKYSSKDGLTVDKARVLIEDHMKEVAREELVSEDEVIVDIFSSNERDMEFVDLPGIEVSSDRQDKDGMKVEETTKDIAKKYLQMKETTAVVVVFDATKGLVSESLTLLRMAPEQIRKDAIGVFAKSDKVYDHNYEDEEDEDEGTSRPGPAWELERDATQALKIFSRLAIVSNRKSSSKSLKNVSIADQATQELVWAKIFDRDDPPVPPALKESVGIDSFFRWLDLECRKKLSEAWIPDRAREVVLERTELQRKRSLLGNDPADITITELVDATDSLLVGELERGADNYCYAAIDALMPDPKAHNGKVIDADMKMSEFRHEVEAAVHTSRDHLVSVISQLMLKTVKECLKGDRTGATRLCRFPDLIDIVESCTNELVSQGSRSFYERAREVIVTFFITCDKDHDKYLESDELKSSLARAVRREMVFPAIQGLKDSVYNKIKLKGFPGNGVPNEDCAPERKRIDKRMELLDEIEGIYKKIHVGRSDPFEHAVVVRNEREHKRRRLSPRLNMAATPVASNLGMVSSSDNDSVGSTDTESSSSTSLKGCMATKVLDVEVA